MENAAKSRVSTQTLVRVALLSAIAFVIHYFDFALPLLPPWMQIDVSMVPSTLGAFAISPLAGVTVELIKNMLTLSRSMTGGVGEIANFVISAAFVFVAGVYYKAHRTKKGAMLGMLLGGIAMTLTGALMNYFLLLPMYAAVLGVDLVAIMKGINPAANSYGMIVLVGVVPFNIIKAALTFIITLLVYKPLSPLLKRT